MDRPVRETVRNDEIKEQSRLCLGGYSHSRMTEERKEIGLDIGHRCVGHPLSADCSAIACRAVVETIFKTIKTELIWRKSWEKRRQAEMAIYALRDHAKHNPDVQ